MATSNTSPTIAVQPAPSVVAQPVKVQPSSTVMVTSVPMGAPTPVAVYASQRTSGKATASLVCGIIGILIFGIILGPLAIGLGVSAKNDINNSQGTLTGTGQAAAGIVCGAVAIVIWVIVVVLYYG